MKTQGWNHSKRDTDLRPGVLRIQPHGSRCDYSLTLLPEVVCRGLPSSPLPRVSTERPPWPASRSQSQYSRRATHRSRYRRFPYLPTENERLIELRSHRGLHWPEIVKHFKHRTSASLQVQYGKTLRNEVDKP